MVRCPDGLGEVSGFDSGQVPKVQNLVKLRSDTTNLRFETTHPEEKSAPERSGGVPGSRNAIK